MWKTKIMIPGFAIAVAMALLSISALPVAAEGPNYSLDLSGLARVNGGNGNGHQWGNGAWLPGTIFMASTELPAPADISIGDEDTGMQYFTETVTSIVYVLDPAGINGVDIGDITINFEEGSLSGDIAYGAKAYIYPGYIYYFELAGLDGTTANAAFQDMAGVCWISSLGGGDIDPEF